MTKANPVFVALDTTDADGALALARRVAGHVGGVKLGLEFFLANGAPGLRRVAEAGLPLFLDLKLHDIPNTVAGAMRALAGLDPALTTIHAGGGTAMMRAAVEAARRYLPGTRVLAVTVLTSLDQAAMAEIGWPGTPAEQVARLAALAQAAGADGVVCSPQEVAALRAKLGRDMLLVVPGIRPAWADAGDQKRVMTPAEAMAAGADHLVIGRPITGAADPKEAAARIARELAP